MKGTLYKKLVVTLASLLLLVTLFYIALTFYVTRRYQAEVAQKLNHALAENIVHEKILMADGGVNDEALKELFHVMMVINPAIEFYLIAPDGAILAYSAPAGKVKRRSIRLEPVFAFMNGDAKFPLYGDDPRDLTGAKVFSAAKIEDETGLRGYLYVVLGGEEYESTAQMLSTSYILRLAAILAAGGLMVTLVIGVWSFRLLTFRLQRLSTVVEQFRAGNFDTPLRIDPPPAQRGDEIDRLGVLFMEMQTRIAEQIEGLQLADTTRREMIANVSHDLKTPLAALQGYLETLSLKRESLTDDERQNYIETALKHGQRLTRLTEELFELAVLESGAATVNIEAFSLAELLSDVTQQFQIAARDKGIALFAQIPQHTPFVAGDIGMIERVIDNLIENALKYTPPGGTVTLSLVEESGALVTTVADSGPGISEEEKELVFDRFYRVARNESDAPEGTGLGLAITRRIVTLHGSTITVDSTLGAGAVFSFPLPVVAPSHG